MVIRYQVDLINTFKLGMCKVQLSLDIYGAQLERYCALKDRYWWSLSSEEKDELAQFGIRSR